MAGNPDARQGLAKARLAYLYGVGVGAPDGLPVRSKSDLLEIAMVDRKTLDKHLNVWAGEAEEIARSAADNPLGFGIREDFLASHAADVDFLRAQTDKLKIELETVDEVQEKLENLVEGIRENLMLTSEDFAKILRLLESYFRLSMNRQKLSGLFLATRKAWQESSNVSAALSAAEVTMKENAKRKARQAMEDADRRAPASTDAGAAAAANTGLFRRSST